MTYLADQFLGVEYDTKNPIVFTVGSTSNNITNHCNASGWITRETFLLHMQRTTLKVRMSTLKVLSDSAQVLPCALEELGCGTTSLDPYAYIWDYPDNCVLSVLRTENVNILKERRNYYILVDPIQLLKWCLKLKTTLNNTVENRQTITRRNTVQSLLQLLAAASTKDLYVILVRNGMVPANAYKI